jgi:simple sugar transport system permease protein
MNKPRSLFALNHGTLVGMLLVILCVGTGLINPEFFSVATVFDTLRNLTIVGIFGMGALLVMLSGGIDVSFPAIAAVTSYVAIKLFIDMNWGGPVVVIYGIATVLGVLLGLMNGFFISYFRLPALIVTLGTSSLLYGFNLFFVGSQNLFNIPVSLGTFARAGLLSFSDSSGRTWMLHPATLIFVVIAGLTGLFLRYTMLGRGIYAIGGNRDAAERVGLPVRKIELLVFSVTGGLAAIAGVTQAVFARSANPAALNGSELDVIAAVVLGGVSVTGGKGSVGGALVGLTFVVVMTTSLVMLGVPAAWQKVFVGLALILGIGLAAWRVKQAQTRAPVPHSSMEESHVA